MRDHLHEARVLHRHLLDAEPTTVVTELYAKYRSEVAWNPTAKEERAWQLALKQPWLMGCFDAYLALTNPLSAYRQPIYAMLAIAESMPDHADDFLPKDYSVAGWLRVALAAAQTPVKVAVGWLGWVLL